MFNCLFIPSLFSNHKKAIVTTSFRIRLEVALFLFTEWRNAYYFQKDHTFSLSKIVIVASTVKLKD